MDLPEAVAAACAEFVFGPLAANPHRVGKPLRDELKGRYVASGTISRTFMGYSPCRLCGRDNGGSEYTDGVYAWPSGRGRYIDERSVRLPVEFVARRRPGVVARVMPVSAGPASQ